MYTEHCERIFLRSTNPKQIAFGCSPHKRMLFATSLLCVHINISLISVCFIPNFLFSDLWTGCAYRILFFSFLKFIGTSVEFVCRDLSAPLLGAGALFLVTKHENVINVTIGQCWIITRFHVPYDKQFAPKLKIWLVGLFFVFVFVFVFVFF